MASAVLTPSAKAASRAQRRAGRKGPVQYLLRFVAVGYIGVLILVPLFVVAQHTFADGASKVWQALTEENMLHAFEVTAYAAGYAVVINTVFGVGVSLLLVRYRFPGRRILSLLVDLPLWSRRSSPAWRSCSCTAATAGSVRRSTARGSR